MTHPFAKQPTPMELENLIYEVALNRALILLLLGELEKNDPGITERVQDMLNHEPQRVFGLVSQFVEEASPFYSPLLTAREDYAKADETAEALKSLLTEPPKKKGGDASPPSEP